MVLHDEFQIVIFGQEYVYSSKSAAVAAIEPAVRSSHPCNRMTDAEKRDMLSVSTHRIINNNVQIIEPMQDFETLPERTEFISWDDHTCMHTIVGSKTDLNNLISAAVELRIKTVSEGTLLRQKADIAIGDIWDGTVSEVETTGWVVVAR